LSTDVRHAFLPELKPIALVGENVALFRENRWFYFTVTYIDPLYPFVKDFGAISAGETLESQEVSELEVGEGWLGHFRVIPIDDIEITVRQPKAKTRGVVSSTVVSKISKYLVTLGITNLSEIFVWEGTAGKEVFFDIKNPTDYDLAMSRVLFTGYKYALEELKEKPTRFTALMVGAK